MAPVFGYVACQVTRKDDACGTAERVWGGVKNLKSGKKSHLGPKATERRSIVYTLTVMEETRLMWKFTKADESNGMFQNNDLKFHKDLAKKGVNVGALQSGALDWIFQAWVGKWEPEALHVNNSTTETMIKTTHEGLPFFHPDPGSSCIRIVSREHLEFFKEKEGKGQCG